MLAVYVGVEHFTCGVVVVELVVLNRVGFAHEKFIVAELTAERRERRWGHSTWLLSKYVNLGLPPRHRLVRPAHYRRGSDLSWLWKRGACLPLTGRFARGNNL